MFDSSKCRKYLINHPEEVKSNLNLVSVVHELGIPPHDINTKNFKLEDYPLPKKEPWVNIKFW